MEDEKSAEGGPLPALANDRVSRGIFLAAVLGCLLCVHPLLYLAAWRFAPGCWVALFPENFSSAIVVLGIGLLLECAVFFWVLWRVVGRWSIPSSPGRLWIFFAALFAGIGAGCGAAWLLYMLCWRPCGGIG